MFVDVKQHGIIPGASIYRILHDKDAMEGVVYNIQQMIRWCPVVRTNITKLDNDSMQTLYNKL